MKLSQQRVLDAILALPLEDFADLSFTTKLTEVVQHRTFTARTATRAGRTQLRPATTVQHLNTQQKPIAPGRTQLRPAPAVKQPASVLDAIRARPQVVAPGKKLTVAEKENLALQYAQQALRYGTSPILKFKDTRDGHGIRKLVTINAKEQTLTCRRYEKINPAHFARYAGQTLIAVNEPTGLVYYRELSDSTTHGMGKLVAELSTAGSLNGSYRATTILPLQGK